MSLTVDYNITLDIRRTNYKAISLYQGDHDSRRLIFTLTDDGQPYYVEDNITASFILLKPDSTQYIDACTVNNGKLEILLDGQATIIDGVAYGAIILSDPATDQVLVSTSFSVIVSKTPGYDQIVSSEDKLKALDSLILSLDQMNKRYVTREEYIKNFVSSLEEKDEQMSNAESTREANEAVRINNENIRQTNESNRSSEEATRILNENTRIENEKSRQQTINSFLSAEKARENAESKRVEAEENRVIADAARNEFIKDITNPNILLNSDFTVNSRDISSVGESNRYVRDRWRIKGTGLSNIEFASENSMLCVKVKNTSSSAYLEQPFEMRRNMYENLITRGITVTLCAALGEVSVPQKLFVRVYDKLSKSYIVNSEAIISTTTSGKALYSHSFEKSLFAPMDGGKMANYIFSIGFSISSAYTNITKYIYNIKAEYGQHSTPYVPLYFADEVQQYGYYFQRQTLRWSYDLPTHADSNYIYATFPLINRMRTQDVNMTYEDNGSSGVLQLRYLNSTIQGGIVEMTIPSSAMEATADQNNGLLRLKINISKLTKPSNMANWYSTVSATVCGRLSMDAEIYD